MQQYTNKRIVQIDFDASVAEDLSGQCKELLFTATEACYIRINADDVSITNGFFIPADILVRIPITRGDKVAAIKETSAGKLTIMELF